jgi:hypothetical protein
MSFETVPNPATPQRMSDYDPTELVAQCESILADTSNGVVSILLTIEAAGSVAVQDCKCQLAGRVVVPIPFGTCAETERL